MTQAHDDDRATPDIWSGSRQMNAIETSMWRAEVDPRLRSTVCALLILDTAPDWARLREAHEWASRIVQRFRQRVVEPAFSLGNPVWVTVPSIDLDYHIRRVHLPEPGSMQQLLELVQGVAMRPLDRARPPWEALLIEGLDGGRAAYFLKSHHSVTDGLGSMQLMSLLFGRTREPRADRPESPPVPPPDETNPVSEAVTQTAASLLRLPGAALRAAASLAGAVRDPSRTLDQGRRAAHTLERLSSVGPSSPLLANRSLAWRFLALEVPLADLRAATKARRASVNDGYLAAVLGGFRLYHERMGRPIATMPVAIPVSLRSASDDAGGNRFSGIRFAGPVGEADPAERIALVREQVIQGTGELVDVGGMVSPLVNRLPTPLLARVTASLTAGNDVQMSNIPGIPYPVYLAGAEVLRMFPFGPLPGCAVMVGMVSHNGTCCIGVNADAAAVTDPQLLQQCLVEGFDEVLALAGTGSVAPPRSRGRSRATAGRTTGERTGPARGTRQARSGRHPSDPPTSTSAEPDPA